jgi:hypothetical protein
MPPTPIVGSSLTQGVWTNDSPPYGVARYYYFYATSGISYTVFWNDDYQGDGTKTGSFGVSAYWYSDSVDIFSNQSYGYTYGRTFTASRTGYIMLKVEPLSYYDSIYKVYRYRSGTFAIAYQ